MFKNCFKIAVSIILLFLSSKVTFGQNFNDALRLSEPGLGFNARALGMGNSYISLSDDYSAVYFNPAGLGLLKRMEFAGGLNYSKFNNNTTFFNKQTDYSNTDTKLNQLSYAFPFPTIRGSLVFAIGYGRDKDFNNTVSFEGLNTSNTSMIRDLALAHDDIAFNLGLSYPVTDSRDTTLIRGNLLQSGTILSDGNVGRWSFAGAVEILQDVFVGGTLNIVTGSFKRNRDYYEDDINNIYQGLLDPEDDRTRDFQSFAFNEIIDWDISGWDAKIGLLFQPAENSRVGVSVKFPTFYNINETYYLNASSEFATTGFEIDPIEDEVEYSITTPYILSGGASVNLKGLIVSGELSYIDYSQMEFDEEEGDLSLNTIINNNRDIKDLFRGVLNYNAGAEFRIPTTDLRLRGGFMVRPSAFKNDPSEFDKKYITGGIGYLLDESLSLDLGYAYGWWKNIGENYGADVSVTNQDVKYHTLLMNLSYRF